LDALSHESGHDAHFLVLHVHVFLITTVCVFFTVSQMFIHNARAVAIAIVRNRRDSAMSDLFCTIPQREIPRDLSTHVFKSWTCGFALNRGCFIADPAALLLEG
jgi:hypothetical protein